MTARLAWLNEFMARPGAMGPPSLAEKAADLLATDRWRRAARGGKKRRTRVAGNHTPRTTDDRLGNSASDGDEDLTHKLALRAMPRLC